MAVLKNPPAGTELRRRVDFLKTLGTGDQVRDQLLQSNEPGHRELAAELEMRREPRVWLRHPELVRDFEVLPWIAKRCGADLAAALAATGQPVLDEFTRLLQLNAYHDSTQHQRRDPPQDDEGDSLLAIMESWSWARTAAQRSQNAAYEDVARELGLNRAVVRRAVRKVHRNVAARCDDGGRGWHDFLAATIVAGRALLAPYRERYPGRSRVTQSAIEANTHRPKASRT